MKKAPAKSWCKTGKMKTRLILLVVGLSFLPVHFGSAETVSPFHTFYGQVQAVDLGAKTLTIKSGDKSLVFHYTDETKISSFHGYVRWDMITPGQGAAVVMRLGEGNIGMAVSVRFDSDASRAKILSTFAARLVGGGTISGIAVNNVVAYEAPAEGFSRSVDLGPTSSGIFLLSVRPDGTVADVKAHKSLGNSELDVRAARWLKKWRFHPNTVTEVQIPVTFSRVR